MCMSRMKVSQFLASESGAITVDWVVLTAAVTGFGIASAVAVSGGVDDLAEAISTSLSGATVALLGEMGTGTEAPFEYALLYASDSLYNNWMTSFSTWSDSTLLQMYDVYAAGAENYINSGNLTNAAYYTDLAYAMQQVAGTRGLEVSDGGAALPRLTGLYNDAVAAAGG